MEKYRNLPPPPPPPHFIVPSAGPALVLCTVRSSIIAVLSVTGSLQWSLEVDMMDVGLGVSSFGAMCHWITVSMQQALPVIPDQPS